MTTYNRPRPLSDLVPGLTKDIFGKKNLLFGKMVAEWAHIAGPEISSRTTPLDLKFQKRPEGAKGGAQAILNLGVQTAYALELSYQKGLLIERLNVFFGYTAIKDIKIIQNSEIMSNKQPPKPSTRSVTMTEQQKIDDLVADVAEDDLQAALKKLGTAILSRTKKT